MADPRHQSQRIPVDTMRWSARRLSSDTGFFSGGRDGGNVNYIVASIQCGIREYVDIYLHSFTLLSVFILQHASECS